MLTTKVKFFIAFTIGFVQNLCFARFSSISTIPSNSSPNFEPNSFVSSFPNASLSLYADNLEQSNINLPSENSFSPVVSSTSDRSRSSSQPSHISTISSPLETFISTYTEAVQSSAVLSDVYDLKQTSLQSLEEFLYKTIYSLLMSLGISDRQEIHSCATVPIVENFEVLTYPELSRISANAVGKNLLAEGILNDANAVSLALAFADEHEKSAKRTVDRNFQESKFQALLDGYIGFLKAQGLFSLEKSPTAAKYFREEFSLSGKQFGRKSMS